MDFISSRNFLKTWSSRDGKTASSRLSPLNKILETINLWTIATHIISIEHRLSERKSVEFHTKVVKLDETLWLPMSKSVHNEIRWEDAATVERKKAAVTSVNDYPTAHAL